MWIQKKFQLKAYRRGFHLVTREVLSEIPEVQQVSIGLLHLFIQHTSASLTLNENADPDVRSDLLMATNRIVPEDLPYIHTYEGSDDMPAHIKSSLYGYSLSIPISKGRLQLGTWQGIYICEHRDRAGGRNLVATIQGESNQ